MAQWRHRTVREPLRQIAIVLNCGWQIIGDQSHIAGGIQRLRRPAAGGKTLLNLRDHDLHLRNVLGIASSFHLQIETRRSGFIVCVGQTSQL